jgi:hypothetical protein
MALVVWGMDAGMKLLFVLVKGTKSNVRKL